MHSLFLPQVRWQELMSRDALSQGRLEIEAITDSSTASLHKSSSHLGRASLNSARPSRHCKPLSSQCSATPEPRGQRLPGGTARPAPAWGSGPARARLEGRRLRNHPGGAAGRSLFGRGRPRGEAAGCGECVSRSAELRPAVVSLPPLPCAGGVMPLAEQRAAAQPRPAVPFWPRGAGDRQPPRAESGGLRRVEPLLDGMRTALGAELGSPWSASFNAATFE